MKKLVFAVLFALVLNANAQMQAAALTEKDTIPFYSMTLEELMNVNVTVASQLPMTNRESPGIITILTQEEIRKSGANDLVEILRTVPGFNFCVDVEGVVGIGVRGNWANEGKVLMLIDGIQMNEDLYSTLQFGGHYSIERIKRIEIIRGPGSAMYGGNAEYAVINIVTTNTQDYKGVDANVFYSAMSKTFGSRGASFAAGKNIGIAHLNLSSSIIQSNRSQEKYTDSGGNSYDMSSQSGISDAQYRLDFSLKRFSITGLYDNYGLDQRDGYDQIYLRPYHTEFNAGYLSAKYELFKSERLNITPGIRFKYQQPWSYVKNITDDVFQPFNTRVNKKEYYVNLSYDPSEKVKLIGGAEYYNQLGIQKFDTVFFSNGKKTFSIDNYSTFFQSIIKFNPVNIIFGLRYENNSFYGSSFVPRVGFTKVWEKFHIKSLYSRAFRSPSVENINASPEISPEQTIVTEFEAGCRLLSQSYLTANIFDIKTRNPIVFYYDSNDEDRYKNETSTGTRGFEVEYKWKAPGWYAAINYSYYTTKGHSAISTYMVPDQAGKQFGFPSHKINFSGNIQIIHRVNVSPSFNYVSTRYSYSKSIGGTVSTNAYSPAIYANIAFNFDNVYNSGLSIQTSCMNLFDNNVYYIQPYDGNHQPLPGAGREFRLKLTYTFSFDKNR